MGIFKTRKNKRFNYVPRHYDDKGEGSPFQMKHKFDEYRKTVGGNTGLKSKFKDAWADLKDSKDRKTNRRILIIAGILLLIFLYIIDFDLSIFLPKD
jgi:hypothetical protein